VARGPIDDVLDWVNQQKKDVVYAGVLEPKDKTAFGFGELSGKAAILEQLGTVVEAALNKEKRRD
jgi:hypothetical protein